MQPSDSTQTTISIAGKNNRYNTIQIDGAVNNDLFGLAATGTPGGQTDTQPISLDTIQEIQVAVSPYDIKQGGFTGGAINAITRSGTNDFHGSVYGSKRNEKYIGSNVPQAHGDAIDKPIATFTSDQLGARVGGPILRDKLFFFASGERNKLSQPTGTSADGSTSNSYKDPARAALFQSILTNTYGYNPGSLGDYNQRTNSDLLLGKLDFNVSSSHQVSFRYNYVDALSDTLGQNRNFERLHLRHRRVHDHRQDELGSPAGQQRLRRQFVQPGPRRLPDDPGQPGGAGGLPVGLRLQFAPTRAAPGAGPTTWSPGPSARPERTRSIRTSSRSPTTSR